MPYYCRSRGLSSLHEATTDILPHNIQLVDEEWMRIGAPKIRRSCMQVCRRIPGCKWKKSIYIGKEAIQPQDSDFSNHLQLPDSGTKAWLQSRGYPASRLLPQESTYPPISAWTNGSRASITPHPMRRCRYSELRSACILNFSMLIFG